MIVGTVTATIHATIQHGFYAARRLLVVEREDASGRPTGSYLIAVDSVDAGVGERVLVLDEGTGARQVLQSANGPVRSVIVGIVDEVARGGETPAGGAADPVPGPSNARR